MPTSRSQTRSSAMNTFSSFRFAANAVLRPSYILLHVRHKSAKPLGRLRNHEIKYNAVLRKDKEGNLAPTTMQALLKEIDLTQERIELVAEKPSPIVVVVNIKQDMLRVKRVKEKQRVANKKDQAKELQLTWTSEESDMEHKLNRLRQHLETGARMDVVFSTKPKTVAPPVKIQQQKVADVIERLAEVSTQWRPVEWRKNLAIISLRGSKLVSQPTPTSLDLDPPPETDSTTAEPVVAPPTNRHVPIRPRNFQDLSKWGYQKPPTMNPMAAKRAEKKYPKGGRP
ncbi:hypothetical protein MIND_00694500 [Mycena indigotica]|uniref:Translation initiation factor 3 N-terminal domain-containing protein n=1 Tax=Mycena indigotica TaxID=2126181 RepID=A0A8H6SKB0_9AGAR|nr:uncharacterized protein MIND_00694500 [Mycena indigotica]KAF7301295.1 hypothetical protein MIND_00694500 [Mycena indigotica]